MHTSKCSIILAVALIAAVAALGQKSADRWAPRFSTRAARSSRAKVVLKNEVTGADRETVSNGSGFFNIPPFNPGPTR